MCQGAEPPQPAWPGLSVRAQTKGWRARRWVAVRSTCRSDCVEGIEPLLLGEMSHASARLLTFRDKWKLGLDADSLSPEPPRPRAARSLCKFRDYNAQVSFEH